MNQIKVLLVGSSERLATQLMRLKEMGTISVANAIAWTDSVTKDIDEAIERLAERGVLDIVILSNLSVPDQPMLQKCSLLAQKMLMHPDKPWLYINGRGAKRTAHMFGRNGLPARRGSLGKTISARRFACRNK